MSELKKRGPQVLSGLGDLKTLKFDDRGVGRPTYRIVKNRATVELEKFHPLKDGYHRARCPLCAEHGKDEEGRALLIDPNGNATCWTRPAVHEASELKLVMSKAQTPNQMEVQVASY